jgi:hypothetical protein
LIWDLMAPAKLDIQQRTLNATLHQVSQIWHWQVLDVYNASGTAFSCLKYHFACAAGKWKRDEAKLFQTFTVQDSSPHILNVSGMTATKIVTVFTLCLF